MHGPLSNARRHSSEIARRTDWQQLLFWQVHVWYPCQMHFAIPQRLIEKQTDNSYSLDRSVHGPLSNARRHSWEIARRTDWQQLLLRQVHAWSPVQCTSPFLRDSQKNRLTTVNPFTGPWMVPLSNVPRHSSEIARRTDWQQLLLRQVHAWSPVQCTSPFLRDS